MTLLREQLLHLPHLLRRPLAAQRELLIRALSPALNGTPASLVATKTLVPRALRLDAMDAMYAMYAMDAIDAIQAR